MSEDTHREDQDRSQTQQIPIDMVSRQEPRRKPALVVIDGRNLGAMFEVTAEDLKIGRDPDCHLMVDEVGVSRNHAAVFAKDDQVWVRDCESKNGTYVNGRMIEEAMLEDGDLMFVGQTTLKYLAEDNVEQSYYEYLHQVTVEDPLTRIPNRRYFDEFFVREVARTSRYRRPLTLLMLDVDRFKRINDTYGHLVGDMVLREVAELISGLLRQSEFLARYGGEEFALVLPETDRAGGRVIGDRIRRAIQEHAFAVNDLTIQVTMSVGGAVWGPDMMEPRDLIAAADANLYEAKAQGRNRVVM